MRQLLLTLLCALPCAPCQAQTPIRLHVSTCEGIPYLSFDALVRALRVELLAAHVDASFEGGDASDRLSVRVDRCARPERVTLTTRRGSSSRTSTVDLRDVHDAVAVRTLALVLVDQWSSLPPPGGAPEPPTLVPELAGALSSPAVAVGEHHDGRRLDTPRRPAGNGARVGRAHGSPRTEERSASVVAFAGFDGSAYPDGPGFVAGGRLGVSVRHEAGFCGRLTLSLPGTHGANERSNANVLAPGVDLQAGGEADLDTLVLGLSAGLRAGFVAAFVSGDDATEVSGILDVTVTLRLRLPIDGVLGVELESGVGHAVIGFPGTRSDGLLAWHGWWIPVRAALTATLF